MKVYDREGWLKTVPEVIYKLKREYNFYWPEMYVKTQKDIMEIINPEKHRHKIMLYNIKQRFFIVIYTKRGPQISYTDEYKNDTRYNRIKYFMNKFKKVYKKAEDDRLYDTIENAERERGSL
jgi:hypothetical protein